MNDSSLLLPATHKAIASLLCKCRGPRNFTRDQIVLRDSMLSCPHCGKAIDAPRFSPTRLAALCVPEPCLRCYFMLMNLGFKKPFDFGTPYIMQLLDRHQKRLANFALSQDGELPKFFGSFKHAARVIPVDRLWCYHPETNIQMVGYPDLVFGFEDETAGILDNKTALAKVEGDALYYAYRAQTCCYKYMLEHGPNPMKVSRLGLLYYEFLALDEDQMSDAYNDDDVWARFRPKFIEVDGSDSDSLIAGLLKRLRALLDMQEAPAGKKGCKDCAVVAKYYEWLAQEAQPSPQLAAIDKREYERKVMAWRYRQLRDECGVQPSILNALRHCAVDPNGVLANWDFDSDCEVNEL